MVETDTARNGWRDLKDRAIRDYLTRELQRHKGNRTQTAKALGVERAFVLRLIRRYGLR